MKLSQLNPNQLAWKMLAYIEAEGRDVTYSEIEERAESKGVDLNTLDDALAVLHKFNKVHKRVKGGDIVYSPAVEKPKDPGSHLNWIRHNYPHMDSSNNGSGLEADYSYLFLSPEELDKYKAEVTGRTYVPKKRYEKKPKAVPAPLPAYAQQMLQFDNFNT